MTDAPSPAPLSMDTIRDFTGLELLRGALDGKIPTPPINDLLGMVLVEVNEGSVVFEGEPAHAHTNPFGIVQGGYAVTFLDGCMGCALHTTLGKVSARGTVINAGLRSGANFLMQAAGCLRTAPLRS